MDRSLATLLRSLQTSPNYEDATRLLPSATGLLSRLSNPLNITLLSSHLLSSPHLYRSPVDLQACRSIFSTFYTAALRFLEADQARAHNKETPDWTSSSLDRAAWISAVVRGADGDSPRWRHLLLLGGLLLGFEGQTQGNLPGDLRDKVEAAIVKAANLAVAEKDLGEPNSQACVVFVLNTVFPLIADQHRFQIDYDRLLPELVETLYFSREGLDHGYWLATIDEDVRQVSGGKFSWDEKSTTGIKLRETRAGPLISSMGPLARLLAHTIENVMGAELIIRCLNRIAEFSRNLSISWKQNKLSEIDAAEEAEFLDQVTLSTTYRSLLELLRNTLFAIIIALRAVVGRILTEARLSADQTAPVLAMQCLHILRDTYFISHRFGQQSSSQYVFVSFTSIDILNAFPPQAESFLASIRPTNIGSIPAHPLNRLLDLFFLNISEHFTLAVSPNLTEDLLVSAALPYISATGDLRLSEMYEAAHSLMLAIFATPKNGGLATRHIPFYIESLLQSFPSSLTPRQFRLAVRSIIEVAAPHSSVGSVMPALQEIILDLLRERVQHASEQVLPAGDPTLESTPLLSERSTILMAMVESLPHLPPHLLEEWLTGTAELLPSLHDPTQRSECQQKLWATISNGEMDVERAFTCVTWWTNRGGREMVLLGERPDGADANSGFEMSGALLDQAEAKL